MKNVVSEGELALVTGAASGIGRRTAIRLAERGAFVGLMDRDVVGLQATLDMIVDKNGKATILLTDITNSALVERMVHSFAATAGGIHTVVACAGICVEGFVHETSNDIWDKTIAVNLTGMFYVARATIPYLKVKGGSFTGISSDAGVQGATKFGAYCASKHGVIGLIRCMAIEYGKHGVRSNAICPSIVETPMAAQLFEHASETMRQEYRNSVPLGRFAQASEIASVVAHLSSMEAGYTNGVVYMIDGGATAGYNIS